MQRVRLGRTEVEVGVVGLGSWSYGGLNAIGERSVGWAGHDEGQARAALLRAHELGVNHWDTADVYGDGRSERLIATALASLPRDELFLASKVGWDPGEHEGFYHPDQIKARLERSLKNLGVEALDLYYLHHCDFGEGDARLEDAIALLRGFRDEGKVRFLGLSDWDPARVARLAPAMNPDVVQPYRNVAADTYASSGLQAWVEAKDAGVAFFSPLRHGLLLGKYAAPPEFPTGDFRRDLEAVKKPELLQTLAQHADALRARLGGEEPVLAGLLGALLEDSAHSCALVGLRSPAQVEAAVKACAEPLAAADAAWIRELYAELSV